MLSFQEELNKKRNFQQQEEEKKISDAANCFLLELLSALDNSEISSIKKLIFNMEGENIFVETMTPCRVIYKKTYSTDIPKIKILKKISQILSVDFTLEECGKHSFSIKISPT